MFITVPASPRHRRMSIEDLWFGEDDVFAGCGSTITNNETNTLTREFDNIPNGMKRYFRPYNITTALLRFNQKYAQLLSAERHSLYHTFYVPKSSGGLRRIDAPQGNLMQALRELKELFEKNCGARWLYHTTAFAYIRGRSTIDCVKRHQINQSKWFGKFDLHNFFGSTTMEFVLKMFKEIYPFCQLFGTTMGEDALKDALSLCFLDGVLPQGTPISPMLTNIIMIPIDFELSRALRERGLMYTRYADDFLISSRKPFMFRDVEAVIKSVLQKYGAPFELNTQKTRYGSANGANWNFGIMLNKDNQMTIGRGKKKQFESMLAAYAKDKRSGNRWSLEEVQHLEGLRSYYKMIEGETIDRIIKHIADKHGVDIAYEIKRDLRGFA